MLIYFVYKEKCLFKLNIIRIELVYLAGQIICFCNFISNH